MTLLEYIEHLKNCIRENPEVADMLVVFASDDEGNSFQAVGDGVGEVIFFEDLDDYYLEPADEEDGSAAFCIN